MVLDWPSCYIRCADTAGLVVDHPDNALGRCSWSAEEQSVINPFILTSVVRFSAMSILLVAGLYAKRLPPRNRRLWPIVGALVFCAILTIGETVYLRMYHEGWVHQHMERLPAST